jgi:hypothetical protein
MTGTSGFAGNPGGENATLTEGTHITLQLNDYLSTKLNNEGDKFSATVMEPIYLDDRLVVPKGSLITGSISRVVRPGRFKGKALMNLLFHSLRIQGRGEVPITASLVKVDAEGSAGVHTESTIEGERSIGKDVGRVAKPAAAGGTIGVVARGGKGGIFGTSLGAAAGLISIFATRGKDLELRRGSTLEVSLDRPLNIPVELDSSSIKN